MTVLTVRRLRPETYSRLKEQAQLHHRSMEAEARVILEAALRRDREALAREAADCRARLAGRWSGDALREIREGRER
jgi:plasmid stability protein